MSRNFHLRIDLRGALRNWHAHEWRNCVKADDGHTMTPDEVQDEFFNMLQKGVRFIPCGPCDNFDAEKGCLGHPVETDQGQARLRAGTPKPQSSET
jgi:hypothetical protein